MTLSFQTARLQRSLAAEAFGQWRCFIPQGKSQFWMPRWEVWNREAKNRKIWRVTYSCISTKATASRTPADLGQIASDLLTALREIHDFAIRVGSDNFAKCFANAIAILETNKSWDHLPPKWRYPDLSPPQLLNEDAARLLDACQAAWVFGGMGSWNDLVFEGEDENEYSRVSERLFQSICNTICVATNSSAP